MFDLLIIGAGPAGYRAAELAAKRGLKTAVFEKRDALGGVCLNEGCVPTKTLLHCAKIYKNALNGKAYGVRAEGLRLEHIDVIRRKNKVVRKLSLAINDIMKNGGITVVTGEAHIEGHEENGGVAITCAGERFTGKNLLVACGSSVAVPPIPGLKEGLESGFVLTSAEMLDIKEVPESLAVIGGGVVGLEMAAYFSAAGAKVSVVEALPNIGGGIDESLAGVLKQKLEKDGIDFYMNSPVKAVENGRVLCGEGDAAAEIECQTVLIATGRKAAANGIGLGNIGVEAQNGAIATNEKMQTNVPNVYAAGDCNGKSMLAHTALREAAVAVNTICGRDDAVNYGNIPAVIYTDPEIAVVGQTLAAAQANGLDAEEITLPMAYSGRYVAETERGTGEGRLVVEKGTNRVLGVHLAGSYASEMIWGAALMLEKKLTAEDMAGVVFPHPTVSEIIGDMLFRVDGITGE